MPPFQLPVRRLVPEQVPSQFRQWVEAALVGPLNRILLVLEGALGRVTTDRLNVQVLEHKGLVPSEAAPVEFTSTLSGPCLGVVLLSAATLDAGGTPTTPVGGLSSPTWREVAGADRAAPPRIRLTGQTGLAGATRYAVKWLAVGQ